MSYSSQDRETVVTMVDYLEKSGFAVWWDQHIGVGQAYDRDIEAALDAAKVVIVVWSSHAVESDWVRAEANEGMTRGILVPVVIDDSKPPLVFRRIQGLTLRKDDPDNLAQLAAAVEVFVPGKRSEGSRADTQNVSGSVRPETPQEIPKPTHESTANWDIPPFVGREQTLSSLRNALDATNNKQGQIVLLAGEAGIGKSRTMQEFANLAQQKEVAVFTGWCDESMYAPPYWPWIRLLQSMLEAYDSELRDERPGASGSVLASILPEIHDVWPELPEIPDYSPERLSFELAQGICSLIKRCAKRQTQLIVLDDLHCADEQTLQVLTTLSREIARSSVFVLGTFRDLEVEGDHRLSECLAGLSRANNYRRLQLTGLSRKEIERFLVQNALDATDILDAIIEKTEGNPLFVTEISRTVNNSAADNELFDLQSLVVPKSLKELVLGRLRDLSTDCREVLAMAAVMGRELHPKLLESMGGFSAEMVASAILEATRAGIVGAAVNTTVRFTHILIKDAIYDDIPRGNRADIHRVVADAFVSSSDSGPAFASNAETIAYHYQEAGETEKAIGYWEQAAAIAIGQSALSEAILRLQKALILLPDLDQPTGVKDNREIRLRLTLGNTQTLAGGAGSTSAIPEFQRVLELCNRYPHSPALFYAVNGIWGYHAMQCDQEAFPLVERQLELAQQHNSNTYSMLASNAEATTHFFQGNFKRSLSELESATLYYDIALEKRINSGKQGPWRNTALSSPLYYAWAMALVGQAGEGGALAEKIVRQAVDFGTHAHVQALTYRAAVYETVRDYAALQTISEQIIEIAHENGYASWLAVARCTRGWAISCLGDPHGGLSEAQQGCEDYRALGGQLCVTYRNYYLADIMRMSGSISDAIRLVEHTLESSKQRFEHFYDAELIRLRGLCAMDSDEQTGAYAYLKQAYDLARNQGAKLFELRSAATLLQCSPEKIVAEDLARLLDELKDGIGETDLKIASKSLADL